MKLVVFLTMICLMAKESIARIPAGAIEANRWSVLQSGFYVTETMWIFAGLSVVSFSLLGAFLAWKKKKGYIMVASVMMAISSGVVSAYSVAVERARIDTLAQFALSDFRPGHVRANVEYFAKHATLNFSEKLMWNRAYAFVYPGLKDWEVAFSILDRNMPKWTPSQEEYQALKKSVLEQHQR